MSVLGAGFYGPTEGEKKRKAVADAARKMAKVIEELPNTSDEEKAELKRDLRNIGVNALSTADHDFCDACGKCTVVTDVWIDRTPMTLCQPCVLDALTAEGRDVQLYVGRLAHRHRQDRMGARLRPLVTWPMVATRTDVAVADDQRRVMCGDRVLAGQWSGVVAAQHGPFSWVVIDGINVPQTHATITLRPVENSDGE